MSDTQSDGKRAVGRTDELDELVKLHHSPATSIGHLGFLIYGVHGFNYYAILESVEALGLDEKAPPKTRTIFTKEIVRQISLGNLSLKDLE